MKLRFCIVYLESVGDHPSLNFGCTSLDKCSERIMLRRSRHWLEGQIQLNIICIHKDTRRVVLNPVEDPRYIHDT